MQSGMERFGILSAEENRRFYGRFLRRHIKRGLRGRPLFRYRLPFPSRHPARRDGGAWREGLPARHPQYPERAVPVEIRERLLQIRGAGRARRDLGHRPPAPHRREPSRYLCDRDRGHPHERRVAHGGDVRRAAHAVPVLHHLRRRKPHGRRGRADRLAGLLRGGRQVRASADRGLLLADDPHGGGPLLRRARPLRPHADHLRQEGWHGHRHPGELHLPESWLRASARPRSRRDGGGDAGRHHHAHRARRGHGNLLLPLGLLRLSRLDLRGSQRGDGALPLWRLPRAAQPRGGARS